MGSRSGGGAPRRPWRQALGGLLTVCALGVGLASAGDSGAQASSVTPVVAFGASPTLGWPNPTTLVGPVVAMARTPDGKGYWLLGADGGVFSFGDARFFGSAAVGGSGPVAGNLPPPMSPSPFTAMAPTPDGQGYWLVDSVGDVGAFGDAGFYGSMQQVPGFGLRGPVVAIEPTPDGKGYWLAGADGGVFSFGDARFFGSVPGLPRSLRPSSPVVALVATPDGQGYWEATAAGDVYSFGDAPFFGSLGRVHLAAPIVAMVPTPDGKGYWLAGADGGVFSFGDARFFGSLGAAPPSRRTPVVAMASSAGGAGYWLATSGRTLPPAALPAVLDRCNFPESGPAIEPATIVLACGDGNAFLGHLDWSTWTVTEAQGSGLFFHNTCQPDCADGTFVASPATVTLSDPVLTGAGFEFSVLEYQSPGSGFSPPPGLIPTNAG
jgi:hypothetical protein